MKKVEELNGKVFIDGVEYEKVETEEVYMGVKIRGIEKIYEALDGDFVSVKYNKTTKNIYGHRFAEFENSEFVLNNNETQAIKSLIKKGIEKAREESNLGAFAKHS